MLLKLRRATVNPDRTLLQGTAEVDGAPVPCRSETAAAEPKARGRSGEGNILLAGVVELSERGESRRIRLIQAGNHGGDELRFFIAGTVKPGARVVTNGWSGYSGLPENPRQTYGILKRGHRVFSSLKRWAMGVLHGLRSRHFQRYLDEFVFRWNRRRHRRSSFDTLLGIGLRLKPATYRDFVDGRA